MMHCTSRRTKVRVAVRPVDVGPLTTLEARELVRTLETEPGLGFVADLSDAEIDRIATACDGLPLAVRWTLARALSAEDSIRRADELLSANVKDDELLEFSFRRVLEAMEPAEQAVMRALSIFQDPTPLEALVAGTKEAGQRILDALDDLVADALAQRLFDPSRNDYVYTLAPLTRTFVYSDLSRQSGVEQRLRKRLSDWYEARDIGHADERVIVRELRQGKESPESPLLDLAQSAQRRGDMATAQDLYEQSLTRNPNSWRAARTYAEFERHVNQNVAQALVLYERAGANAPSRGQDRALIFREWGMLLRDSGEPDATDAAIERFEVAHAETPNDPMTTHALATMYKRKGQFRKVIELLEPLQKHPSLKTKEMALGLLVRAYDETTEMLKAAQARDALREIRLDGQ